MNQSYKKSSIRALTMLVLFFVFLASMNVINRYYYFIYIAIVFFCLKPGRRFSVELFPLIVLSLVGVSWVLFSPTSTASVFALIKPFTYLLCFVMGASLLKDDKEYSEKKTPYRLFYVLVLVIALGTLTHYVLNWLTNMQSTDRNTVDFWTQSALAATGQASLACIPIALSVACIFSKTGKRIKIAAWITLVIVFLYNLILAGRTLIIISLVAMIAAFLHQFRMQKRGRLRVMLLIIIVLIALIWAYQSNLFGIKDMFESSPFYERFFSENNTTELDEDGRLRKKLYHLKNMDRFLWGGANIREEIGYAHDIFLDTYDEAGVFAFLGIVGYMLLSLTHLIRCLKDKTLSFSFRQIVFCIYIVVYMEFLVEPILQGMPWLFAAFCIIDGYVSRILQHNKTVNRLRTENESN